MIAILNRMVIVLMLGVGLSILSIGVDFWMISILAMVGIRLFLSKKVMTSFLRQYEEEWRRKIQEELGGVQEVVQKPVGMENIAETERVEMEAEDEALSFVSSLDIRSTGEEQNDVLPVSPEPETKSTVVKNEPISKKTVDPSGYAYAGDPEYTPPPSKIAQFLTEFFATNLLAKIGGIILAIGILFLMGLIYTRVGDGAKIGIGFSIAFIVYGAGYFLEKKGLTSEAMILFGTGILMNYIVILGGRFFIGDDGGYLSAGVTLPLLIANTLFSVGTGLVYQSRTVLVFSTIFVFLVPLFVREQPTLILTLYTVFASVGGIVLSYFLKYYTHHKDTLAIQTLWISLVGGNILTLLFSFGVQGIDFVVQMVGFLLINLGTWIVAYMSRWHTTLLKIFIVSFLFVVLTMMGISLDGNIWVIESLGGVIFALLLGVSFFLTRRSDEGVKGLVLFPLLLVFAIVYIGGIEKFFGLFGFFGLVYMVLFSLIHRHLSSFWQYFYFGVVGVFLGVGGIFLGMHTIPLSMASFTMMHAVAGIFMLGAYFFARQNRMQFLYFLGTIFSILMLWPMWQIKGDFMLWSVVGIFVVWFVSYVYIYLVPRMVTGEKYSLFFGSGTGALLAAIAVGVYGNVYLDNTLTALVFLLGSGAYLGSALFAHYHEKLDAQKLATYHFSGISLVFFTLALVVGLAHSTLLVGIAVFGEALILLVLNRKLKDGKLVIASMLLSVFAGIRCLDVDFYGLRIDHNIFDGIYMTIIALLSTLQICVLKQTKSFSAHVIRVVHIVIVATLYGYIDALLVYEYRSWFFFIMVSLGVGLYGLYMFLADFFLKYATFILAGGILLVHSILFGGSMLWSEFLATGMIAVWLVLGIFLNDPHKKILSSIGGFYLFVMTSQYVWYTFFDTFVLTIYWAILSIFVLYGGFFLEKRELRGIGLYLIILVLAKITFYDVWNKVDEPIIRVVALIFVGAMMVYISTLYTRKKLSMKDDLLFHQKPGITV